jgi:outer membrane protein TolC
MKQVMQLNRTRPKWFPCIIAISLQACASGAPIPTVTTQLAPGVDRLSIDVSSLRLAPLRAHIFDPSDGLDPTEVAVLAVLNSPDLTAKRAAAGIAGAQAFAAGLLPDPQIALSADFPLHPSVNTTAYNVNPSLDLVGLLTHSTALRAARASSRQADLDLLWAEWSTAQQARLLAVTALACEERIRLLESIAAGIDRRIARTNRALKLGDSSLSATAADLAAGLDTRGQIDAARHDLTKARGDLNALIGLDPAVRLNLVAGPPPVEVTEDAIDRALASLPHRRPDLLALGAGREAQDAILRKSILARFPLINLGFSHQQDNGAAISNGLAATLVIPIFNGGRGDLAIQKATRDSLSAEYQARLDETVAEVAAARRDRNAARMALARLQAQLPAFTNAADRARDAELRRDIDSATYLALDQAAVRARLSVLDQQVALESANVSLETVLFLPSDESKPS